MGEPLHGAPGVTLTRYRPGASSNSVVCTWASASSARIEAITVPKVTVAGSGRDAGQRQDGGQALRAGEARRPALVGLFRTDGPEELVGEVIRALEFARYAARRPDGSGHLRRVVGLDLGGALLGSGRWRDR